MRDLPTYAERFDYGRLLADSVRVLVRAGPQIAVGVLVLGVAPTIAGAMPWWSSRLSSQAFPRIWTTITVAKAALGLLSHAAMAAFLSCASLKVLSGASWTGMLRPGRLAAGFATSLCLGLFVNWASLVSPFAAVYAPVDDVRWMLLLSVPLSLVVSVAAAGLAVPVAVAEQASVAAAVAESFRLLHGLRWRIVALCLGYLVLLAGGEALAVLLLVLGQVAYASPGLGRAVIGMAPLLSGALLNVVFAAFFMQARRIADGLAPAELHDVFG